MCTQNRKDGRERTRIAPFGKCHFFAYCPLGRCHFGFPVIEQQFISRIFPFGPISPLDCRRSPIWIFHAMSDQTFLQKDPCRSPISIFPARSNRSVLYGNQFPLFPYNRKHTNRAAISMLKCNLFARFRFSAQGGILLITLFSRTK